MTKRKTTGKEKQHSPLPLSRRDPQEAARELTEKLPEIKKAIEEMENASKLSPELRNLIITV